MKNSHSYNDNGLWHTKWTNIFSKRLQYHQTTICIDLVSDAVLLFYKRYYKQHGTTYNIYSNDTMPLAVT